uniref:Genome polyprotein n=1 Tax=Duck picornavirus TaxID=2874388 RepID=A0AA50A913_9PICO|nr:polyprotein [Duck picornavirus]
MEKLIEQTTSQITTALDVAQETKEILTDTLAGGSIATPSNNAAITTSEPTKSEAPPDPTDGSADDFLSCAYTVGPQEANIEKMVHLISGSWSTSATSLQSITSVSVPAAFYSSDTFPAWGQVRNFRLIRTAYHLKLVVNGPAGISGALALIYCPPSILPYGIPGAAQIVQTRSIVGSAYDGRSIFNLPHVILDPRVSTEVSLTVPYMNYENYVNIRSTDNAKLLVGGIFYVVVVAPLADSVSNVVGFSVYGEFIDLDLQAPCYPTNPQGRRKTLRRRRVANPGSHSKPHTLVVAPGPGAVNAANSSLLDDIQTLAIGNERTAVDMRTAGARANIDDMMRIMRRWNLLNGSTTTLPQWNHAAAPGTEITGLELALTDSFWPNMRIFADKFQYFRGSLEIKVVVYATSLTSGKFQVCWYPFDTTRRTANALQAYRNSVFITGDVSSVPTILILPYTSSNWRLSTRADLGRVSVIVVNQLSTAAGTLTAPRVAIFGRVGSDFRFYAPRFGSVSLNQTANGLEEDEDDVTVCFVNFDTTPVDIDGASHTSSSVLFGRSWYVGALTAQAPNLNNLAIYTPRQGVPSLLRSVAYWSGEVVFTVISYSDNPAYVAHTYDEAHGVSTLADLTTLGAVIIPPRQTKTFVAPFYSVNPLRCTASASGRWFSSPIFGHLVAYIDGGRVEVFQSLRRPNLFAPVIMPSYVSTFSEQEPFDIFQEEQGYDSVDCHFCDICEKMAKWRRRGDRRFRFCLRLRQLGFELNLEYSHTSQKELSKQGIEPNPGPYLVYQDRGLYNHYGVASGNKVYHVNSANILKSALTGEAEIIESVYDSSWQIKQVINSDFLEHYLKLAPFEKLTFSINSNCETWARAMTGTYGPDQGTNLKYAVAAMIIFYIFTNLPHLIDPQSGNSGILSSLLTKMTDLIFGSLECQVLMFVIKAVVRILCYLVLYAHAPNLMTTACLATLLIMDVNSGSSQPGLKALCSALVEGDFRTFCELLLEKAQVVDYREAKDTIPQFSRLLDDQGAPSPKPFNDWTNAAKNVKWWITSIMEAVNWIREFFCPKTEKIAEWVEEHETEISTVIAVADEHITKLSTDKKYATSPDGLKTHKQLIKTLGDIYHNISLQKNHTQFTSRISSLINKLTSIQVEVTPSWECRQEPIGLWITGAPGCGKSFFANMIAKRVRDELDFTIYSNPTGSNYMDGYTNQDIHIFDDFGQNREEPEFGLICNLMSSIQFAVPKAALEQKGTFYQGKLVIITTNKHDFSSCTLLDPGALERRFPYKYHIRPRSKYMQDGKFNAELAAKTGDLRTGECWERLLENTNGSDQWVPLNVDFLVGSIIDAIKMRKEIASLMNQGPTSTPIAGGDKKEAIPKFWDNDTFEDIDLRDVDFTPFVGQDVPEYGLFCYENPNAQIDPPPQEKVTKYKSWVSRFSQKLRNFFIRHQPWIIAAGCLGTLCSVGAAVYQLYHHFKGGTYNESPYTGQPTRDLPKKNFATEAAKKLSQYIGTSDQGPVDLRHICRRLVNLKTKKHTITGLALCNKVVITYGHDPIEAMVVEEGNKEIEVSCEKITYNDEDTDLQLVKPKNEKDLGYQFKNVSSLIYKGEFHGKGWLIWKFGEEYIIQEVSDITFIGSARTRSGTQSAAVYLYNAKTTAGTCGGLLVGNVDGCPKILGIHTSGNGATAAANRIFPVLTDQGVVTHTEKYAKPLYFQPRKSKYRESPFNDGSSTLAPAVLSKNDPRLEVEIEDITLHVARKYRVDRFDPPKVVFESVKIHLTRKFFSVIGLQQSITFEQAISTEILPIDWSTSPGHKYPGRSKRELAADPKFKEDVLYMYYCGSAPRTYFTAYLKDELRPLEKVKEGNTRCIEASNWDYTIYYRMVMGNIYKRIYEDRWCETGCAVGMNAFTDFDVLHQRGFDYYLCLDFKKFDGSLSMHLLRHAVDILKECHVDHYLVECAHEPTIMSRHQVSDEIWDVSGGMCSGSPCTTVVNSVCNLLVCYTAMLSAGLEFEDLFIVTYGDDVVISSKKKVDLSHVPLMIKIFFGMEVTAADKTDNLRWVSFLDIEFLKRTPTVFHGKIVGALSLQNMRDRIQWTRGGPDFDAQVDSFLCELVLHGREAYEKEVARLKAICPIIPLPPYSIMEAKMRSIIFM